MEILSMCISLLCYDINWDEYKYNYPNKNLVVHEKDVGAVCLSSDYKTRYWISDFPSFRNNPRWWINCFER